MTQMVRKHFLITEAQEDFLEGLDDISSSEHVRRAIDEYIAKRRKTTVSTSSSKKGVQQ